MNLSEIKEIIIKDNPNASSDSKRLIASFIMKTGKTINRKFGMHNSGGTYADGADLEKKKAYISRHQKRENWNNIFTPGSLSRFVLWEFRTNKEIENFYNRHFRIPKIKIQFKRYKLEN